MASIIFISLGAASKQEVIEGIRREKEATDKLKMRIKAEDVHDESTEGGEAKYYYDGNTLKKIVARLYFETGDLYTEYYIKNNKVYFIYEKWTERQHWAISEKQEILKVEESRYYLDNNGKLVRYADEKGKIHESRAVLNEKAGSLKKYKPKLIRDML